VHGVGGGPHTWCEETQAQELATTDGSSGGRVSVASSEAECESGGLAALLSTGPRDHGGGQGEGVATSCHQRANPGDLLTYHARPGGGA